jgi:hypothetical protein
MTLLPKLGEPEAPQALRQEPLTVQVQVIVLGSLSQGNGEQIEEASCTAYVATSNMEL